MKDDSQSDLERTLYPIVRYLHDCLAAQTEWSRDLNLLARKDVLLCPLTRRQTEELGTNGSLALSHVEAIELGNRLATAEFELSLRLGALFLVGRLAASESKPERRICAPLLEVPLTLTRDLSRGRIIIEPEDDEFSVNFALMGEILRTASDDLRDRLADLADLVPDFPIDPGEFREFWNGFRMVAPGLPFVDELPKRRRKQMVAKVEPDADGSTIERPPHFESVDEPRPLELVDFYLPRIPRDARFRLLPATTIILGKRAGHVFSALRELDGMTRQPIDQTSVGAVFGSVTMARGKPAGRSSESEQSADGEDPKEIELDSETSPDIQAVLPDDDVTLDVRDAHPLPLTTTQQAVVQSARTAALTVVTGPPGTGKSYTITAIVLDAILRGQSVLVASQMDQAVEVVAEKVDQIAGAGTVARSGGRKAQRALAEQVNRMTGPKTPLQQFPDVSKATREKSAKRHGELTKRLARMEQRYRSAIEQERIWSASHDACERLVPICPVPIHEISARAYRRAKASLRRAQSAFREEPCHIRLPVQGTTLRTFVRARFAVRTAKKLLAGQPGLFSRWRAARLQRRALRLFGANRPRSYSVEDIEQAMRHWWCEWQKQRVLENLRVPADWVCSLEELDEAITVQGHSVAVREAERELRVPFAADLLWREIANLEKERTEEALKLLRLNREATLQALTRSNCRDCNGSGRVPCERCTGSGRVRRSCGRCKGSGEQKGPCQRCHGFGWTLRDFGRCSACSGSGHTSVCSACQGSGSIDATKQCPKCRGKSDKKCASCRGKGVSATRSQLRMFGKLLRRRNRKLKRELREKIDLSVPLRAFPGWASTNRALGEILPATPGLFDLVVIDEASQCDLATAAVALLRGRRAVIVGDPNQLRHISFLSKVREQASFAKHGLDEDVQERYRYRRSLFDVAADAVGQDRFFMLDQHFRSQPHIIDFSNRKFYDGRLRIMTERPRAEPHSAVRWVYAAGKRSEGVSVNPAEVEAVSAEVAAVFAAGDDEPPSIGIVSPFRDHVDAVWEKLNRKFSPTDLEKHSVVVGTAHSLQGDERDIVIFSTSVDTECHSASLRFLENPNLFNVAVTRARRRLIVITSVTVHDLPAGLLREFLQHAQGCLDAHKTVEEFDNEFEKTVAGELRQQQLELWPNFLAAGVRIDVVAATESQHLAVLCDGPSRSVEESIDPLTCHRILARAGWDVKRIPRRSWLENWYDCFDHIRKGLEP